MLLGARTGKVKPAGPDGALRLLDVIDQIDDHSCTGYLRWHKERATTQDGMHPADKNGRRAEKTRPPTPARPGFFA